MVFGGFRRSRQVEEDVSRVRTSLRDKARETQRTTVFGDFGAIVGVETGGAPVAGLFPNLYPADEPCPSMVRNRS